MAMGFRFRKRFKIIPGIWLNLSKSWVSTSIGGKGLTANFKDGKTKTTANVPGTSLNYSETSTGTLNGPATEQHAIPAWVWLLIIVVLALVFLVKYSEYSR